MTAERSEPARDVTREVFVSVDVETAGPIPGEFSLLTIGACGVDDPNLTFACELQPVTTRSDPDALRVTGLSLDVLARRGLPPEDAMRQFAAWVEGLTAGGGRAVFVGLNAPFDWSFVNYYFHRFLGHNPFGFSALDIKAYYMGVTGCAWDDTRSSRMTATLKPSAHGNHQALADAKFQAELFRLITDLRVRRPNV